MKHPILFLASCLAAISFAVPARATDYYAAANGSQSAAGTLAAPFSVFKAASTAKAGDTVYLRGGTYSGSLTPQNSGTASAWITFAAYPGELPIFDGKGAGGTGIGSSTAQYVRFVGLVARNYSSGGFANGWTGSTCSTMSNGNLQFVNCIADGNGINGIAFYCASNLLIDESIVLHNGNTPPSWSSGVNLFHVYGDYTTNIVQRTVSFENVDVCGQASCTAPTGKSSDGSGFILDQNSTGALFANNIGFRNGGSCIRLTNSAGAHLVNNTCYHDGLSPADAQSQPTKPGEIYFSDSASKNGAVFFNNLAAASGYNNDQTAFAGLVPSGQTNFSVNSNAATPFFSDAAGDHPDFHLTSSAQTNIIDKGTATNAPATDIGFDPKCLSRASGAIAGAPTFWQYQVDYAYITSIGGVAACFKPNARSATPDIGAYEFTSATPACTSAAQCDDSDVCTTDACSAGACSHSAVAACCKTAADCNDGNACTTDSCSAATGVCGHASVAGCCLSASDCNDTNPCTTDTCNTTSHVCGHSTVSGCCQQDSACNDGNACTADTCNLTTHQCATQAISSCCNQDTDCGTTSSCVQTTCNVSTHACVSAVIPSCCTSNASCDDQNPCTADTCNTSSGACTNTALSACCQLDGDCADQDPCTTDRCNLANHSCSHTANPSCCTLDAQCGDNDSCTLDSCNLSNNACAHTADPACNAAGAGGANAGGANAGGASAGGASAGGASAGGASSAGTTDAGGTSSGGAAGSAFNAGGAGSAGASSAGASGSPSAGVGGFVASAGAPTLGGAGANAVAGGGVGGAAAVPVGPTTSESGATGGSGPGCACSVPSEQRKAPWGALMGLSLGVFVGLRRRVRRWPT